MLSRVVLSIAVLSTAVLGKAVLCREALSRVVGVEKSPAVENKNCGELQWRAVGNAEEKEHDDLRSR